MKVAIWHRPGRFQFHMSDSLPSLSSFVRQNMSLALLALAHVPFTSMYFLGLWQAEHYQFFPFAIAAFFWFYITRSDRTVIHLGWIERTAIVLDMLLLVFIVLTGWIQLIRFAMLLFCFAVTRGSREWQYPIRLTYLTLLPLLLTRPPTRLDTLALHWLQENTSWLASRVLEEFGYLHLRRGNIIEVADKEFLVEEACSGVQSLFTVLFLATFIVCWHRRSLLQTCVLFAAGFVFAGAMNVLRISTIVVAWQDLQLDLSHGWQHDAVGYVALVTAVLLLLSTDAMLHFLFAPFEDHSYGPFAGAYSNPLTAVWNFVCGGRPVRPSEPGPAWLAHRKTVMCGLAFSILVGGTQLLSLVMGGAESVSLPESSLADFDEQVLPQELEGFKRAGYTTETRGRESSWGQYSNVWSFEGNGLNVHVSCDHLFHNWHYLNICYTGIGWQLNGTEQLANQSDWNSVTFSMKKRGEGRHGSVIYSHFSVSGEPLDPDSSEFSLAYFIERLRRNSAHGIWSLLSAPEVNGAYQVQVFTESGRPLTDDQFAAIKRLHEATRRLLQEHYLATHSHLAAALDTDLN